MKIPTHLFPVDRDLIPNITPVLDERFRPSRVLLMSHKGCPYAERLKRIIGHSHPSIEVGFWPVDSVWDHEHIRRRSTEFIEKHQAEGVALNASCGNRALNLAVFESFKLADKPIYYLHPNIDHLVWLHPHDFKSFDLSDRIKLPEFFASHDLKIVSSINRATPHFNPLTSTLIKRADYFAIPLGVLNGIAAQTPDTLVSDVVTKQLKDKRFSELVELFEEHGMIQRTQGGSLKFTSREGRFFVNGGWLEEHVFNLVVELRQRLPTIQDVARNVMVEWDEKISPVNNELDVVFLANNRLYIVECKTKQFQKDKSPGSEANQVLYRLHTLRDYFGGDNGEAMFISFRSLTNAPRQRAEEYRIKLCDWRDLRKLDSVLEEWVKS
jgi:hypothetical protein